MRRRGRAFIIGIGIMMAAAALSGCGKKAEEAAVTTEAPTVMPEETKTSFLRQNRRRRRRRSRKARKSAKKSTERSRVT